MRFALLKAGGSALCALLLTGCAPTSPARRPINPPGISPLVPAYSVAIRDGQQVYVSGMTGIKPGTQDIIEGGVEIQTRQTLEKIRTALQAGGATMNAKRCGNCAHSMESDDEKQIFCIANQTLNRFTMRPASFS
jgi:hypothetical protein